MMFLRMEMSFIEIKLIGADTSNGMKILKNLRKVEKACNYTFLIDKIPTNKKNKYNVKVIPTLLIDNKTILSGKVLNEKELSKVIKPLLEAA